MRKNSSNCIQYESPVTGKLTKTGAKPNSCSCVCAGGWQWPKNSAAGIAKERRGLKGGGHKGARWRARESGCGIWGVLRMPGAVSLAHATVIRRGIRPQCESRRMQSLTSCVANREAYTLAPNTCLLLPGASGVPPPCPPSPHQAGQMSPTRRMLGR